MALHAEFSRRSLQSLARLAAYLLAFEYLLNGFLAVVPVSSQPDRLLGQITTLVDSASLPVLAVVLFYGGLLAGTRPARWEWRLARLLRPLLALTAALFLLLIPAVWVVGAQIQSRGDGALRQQSDQVQQQLSAYRASLSGAADANLLRRLIEAQPLLQPALAGPESPFARTRVAFADQRRQAVALVDRAMANVRADSLERRAGAVGSLRKQQWRLTVLALVHALFFALSALVWPDGLNSLAPGRQVIDAIEPSTDA